MAEPAPKKQKTVEAAAKAKDEEVKEAVKESKPAPAAPVELEKDAPADARPKVKDPVGFATADTTLNVMPCGDHNVLMCMTESGVQHLLAGARANLGLKSGRYMFEVKTIEHLHPQNGWTGKPKNVVKVGFATSRAGLLLGGEGTVSFDSDGNFHDGTKQTWAGARFSRDGIVAVLLNLDASSKNAHTISLFVGGRRACPPQPLPESLKGKALFPAVTYRSATVHVNWGPTPLCPLPFKCHMVQDAAKADAVAAKVAEPPADGKYEVVVPVGLPDEGAFDWLDAFLAAHPKYNELSDRMVVDWAEKSGMRRQGGGTTNKASRDKPEFSFGLKEVDDFSIRRVLQAFAPLQSRHFVVMELKENLAKESRAATLARFADSHRRVARVLVGEPTKEFKKRTLELTLKAKQEKADLVFKAKKAEEKRKRLQEKRQKELEKAKKKAEKERAKALKKAQEALKKKRIAAKKEGEEDKEEEKEPEEEQEEEEDEEEEEVVEDKMDEDDEEPPKVELDDEEKKLWYRKTALPDMASYTLSTSFAKFTLPQKDEGFDKIAYEWTKEDECDEYLKNWILQRKLSLKIEDLRPSVWFQQQQNKWQLAVGKWKQKLNDYKQKLAKKAADKVRKEAQTKAAAAKKAAEEAKAAKAKEAAEKGEKKEEKKEEKKKEEPAPMEVEEEEEEEDDVDFDGIDIFGVDDVTDIGGGMPLFKDFTFEDWAMMSLYFELHLLAHAFAKDVQDPERPGFVLDHLPFYFNLYFKKPLTPAAFGVETVKDVIVLAKDAVKVTAKGTVASWLPEEMESMQVFVQMTEEARRYRKYRIDLGDASARLKLKAGAHSGPAVPGKTSWW